jgi:hypothetical protein
MEETAGPANFERVKRGDRPRLAILSRITPRFLGNPSICYVAGADQHWIVTTLRRAS